MNDEMLKRFEVIEKRLDLLEGIKQEEGLETIHSKKKSVKEFLLEKSPNDGIQNATCIAYYLEKFDNKNILTSKDIKKCFKDAKLKTPPNVPDKIQKAISHGWIAKGDKRGEFYLTTSGEEVVEKRFKKK